MHPAATTQAVPARTGASRRLTHATFRDGWSWVGAPALYLLLSVLWIGRFVLGDAPPGTIGKGPDVQIFIWGLRWWPYAIQHGLDPIVSRTVWPPYGSTVVWSTTVPLLSVIAAPVTLAFGPAASWNLLCVLAPALSAWAAYWLCLELTEAPAAATVGGLLFGFSSYELGETAAHLQVAMIALVPLAGLVAVRYARGRYGGPGLALRMAGIAIAQFLISPEVLATLVFMAAVTAAGAFLLLTEARAAIREGAAWTLAGLALAGLICLPVLIPMLSSMPTGQLNRPTGYAVDLLNLVVPTRQTALGGSWAASVSAHFTGNLAEQGGYLGVPLLIALGAAFVRLRRNRSILLLGLMTGVALVLSLGPRLEVRGAQAIWLPESLLTGLPGLKDAIPDRFALYTTLGAAMLVALWLADASRDGRLRLTDRLRPARHLRPASVASGRGRWLLVVLAVVCLLPAPQRHLWWRPTPQFIVRNDLRRLIPAGSTVVWLPFWNVADRGLFAQAVDGLDFRLDDRWLQVIPPAYHGVVDDATLAALRHTRRTIRSLERDLCRLGANYVVVQDRYASRRRILAGLKIHPIAADTLLVYRLPQSMCAASRVVA